ncbi:MAG: ABC transporter ATP-binding protein [Chloroflexi bacterium]|nr:ABC transporter ATP-binding protein [Chloroflexota bacterium]
MNDIAIRTENLSKLYHIGQFVGYHTLRESLMNVFHSPFRRSRTAENKPRNADKDYIWALKDVSFEVKTGEVVGIIGRNGAGKTTLLRVLSRITEPTSGHAEVRGRIGSLLEVGTGFHPELTGRENIYLNGAVLGMKKKEIDRKFAEIIDFSGVEKFIDTPLKRYSSGMQVRLAFAVAAHLEPEILIVDEVLAVGDAEFQKKSIGKMGEFAGSGRTVLLVSHNMSAISSLCKRAILLQNGSIVAEGPTPQVVARYLSSGENETGEIVFSLDDAPGSSLVKLHAVRVLDDQGRVSFDTDIAKPINLEIEFWCLQKTRATCAFILYNQLGVLLFATQTLYDEVLARKEYEPGLYRLSCQIPGNLLNDGTYSVNVYLSTKLRQSNDVAQESAVSFRAHDFGTGQHDYITGPWVGVVRPILPWTGSRIGNL